MARRDQEYYVQYNNAQNTTPAKVFNRLLEFLLLLVSESERDQTDAIIGNVKTSLEWTAADVNFLNHPTMTQKERCRKLFEKVETHNNAR